MMKNKITASIRVSRAKRGKGELRFGPEYKNEIKTKYFKKFKNKK